MTPVRPVIVVPAGTSISVAPVCRVERTRISSGFASQNGTAVAVVPAGSGWWMSTPGSRNGRAVPETTPMKVPLLLLPLYSDEPLGAVTTNVGTVTRMPSKRSSWSRPPAAVGANADRSAGVGSANGPASTVVTVTKVNSVSGSWNGSCDGLKSVTVPLTRTRAPIAAFAGGAELVKT